MASPCTRLATPCRSRSISRSLVRRANRSNWRALVAVIDVLGLGDEVQVAQLTTPDVILFDQDERVRWMPSEAADRLPPALLSGADGLGWHLVESSFFWLGSDAAFFSLRYQTSPSSDLLGRTAVESWVLVRTDTGWRVRYLHRSRGPTENGSLP